MYLHSYIRFIQYVRKKILIILRVNPHNRLNLFQEHFQTFYRPKIAIIQKGKNNVVTVKILLNAHTLINAHTPIWMPKIKNDHFICEF